MADLASETNGPLQELVHSIEELVTERVFK